MQKSVRLFLVGDVMLGRGVDQVLPKSVDPTLYESCVKDARDYVKLAVKCNGELPPASQRGYNYPWGVATNILERHCPHVRIVNLETAVTTSASPWVGKSVHYRMHPGNIQTLQALRLDVCVLANNHVLDWGYAGLTDTMTNLRNANIPFCGVGCDLRSEAQAPAIVTLPTNSICRRVIVFAVATESSGVVPEWRADNGRAGVFVVDPELPDSVGIVKEVITRFRKLGDICVLSVHWGSNWGQEVSAAERHFAQQCIAEAGVHLVYGHSSHHVKGFELFQRKLILYGCGDWMNDYEGIKGYEHFRPDLSLMYLPELDAASGNLLELKMIPTKIHQMRLMSATKADAQFLCNLLNTEGSRRFDGTFKVTMLGDCDNALSVIF